jgi:hypothetical protein
MKRHSRLKRDLPSQEISFQKQGNDEVQRLCSSFLPSHHSFRLFLSLIHSLTKKESSKREQSSQSHSKKANNSERIRQSQRSVHKGTIRFI